MKTHLYSRFEQVDWQNWKPVETATLMFAIENGKILLIHKKRGFGAGKISGPGGRLEPGETIEQCAIRETQEELGVTPTGVKKAGELLFQFADGYSIHGHVFTANGHEGEPKSTPEADPIWTQLSEIPFSRMWADDHIWVPLMLKGQPFKARFLFAGDAMLGYDLTAGSKAGVQGE